MDISAKFKLKKAFTLVEVIFAVIILSGSLVVLLGLQSSVVQKSLRDRNQLQAMLVARNILAVLEIQRDLQDLNLEDNVYTILKDLNAIPEDDREEESVYQDMDAQLIVEEWDNPPELQEAFQGAIQNLLRRVYLKIYWGESPDDELEIVYFVKNESPI